MKNQNSNSVATVILISLLTGCSGFSHASTVDIFHTSTMIEIIVSKSSILASIVIAEFTEYSANSDF